RGPNDSTTAPWPESTVNVLRDRAFKNARSAGGAPSAGRTTTSVDRSLGLATATLWTKPLPMGGQYHADDSSGPPARAGTPVQPTTSTAAATMAGTAPAAGPSTRRGSVLRTPCGTAPGCDRY